MCYRALVIKVRVYMNYSFSFFNLLTMLAMLHDLIGKKLAVQPASSCSTLHVITLLKDWTGLKC